MTDPVVEGIPFTSRIRTLVEEQPGMVAVTLTSGSITWYDENCEPTVYNAGDTWLEGSQIHAFKANGTGVQLVAWFITAQGRALRMDQPAPACAANLGL